MPTAYSRLTLVCGTRRVDLALPSALAVAEIMPQLLRFCAPEERVDAPAAWRIGRLGGPELDPAGTLSDAGVADGEVLELRADAAPQHPAFVEDVRDAVEDAVDESGRAWAPRTTLAFALVAGAVLLFAAVLLPEARRPRDISVVGLAVAIAGLGIAGAWWARRRGMGVAVAAALAAAAAWGAAGGWSVASFTPWPPTARAVVAVTGVLVVAALARLVTERASGLLAAAALLVVAGTVVALGDARGSGPLPGLRIAAVFAVLVVGVVPHVSLAAGGLAGADYRVRSFGLLTGEEFASRLRTSTALLQGGLVAAAAVGVTAGVYLSGGSVWDRCLGIAVGAGLLLRSRAFSRIPHILPVRVGGLLVVLIAALHEVQRSPALRAVTIPLAVAVVVAGVGLSAVPLAAVARARVKRVLNYAEVVVVVALVVLAAGASGVYDWVAVTTS